MIDKSTINKASRIIQKKSLENGIPNVDSKNNVLYYQLHDGTITKEKTLFHMEN